MEKPILTIGDIHFPFHCPKSLRAVIDVVRRKTPGVIVQVGDLYDFYTWSKFPNKRSVITPEDEIIKGYAAAQRFWKSIKRAAPNARCYQLKGNHDERPIKRIMEKAPEFEKFVKDGVAKLFQFPGVKVMHSEREELILGNIMFMHGYRAALGDHAKHNNMNTVCGHSHLGGCHFMKAGDKTIWELNCGYLADPTAVPMSYTRQKIIGKWTKGYGWIEHGIPKFVPLRF